MPDPSHPMRRRARPLFALVALGSLASCSDDGSTPPPPGPTPAAVQVASRDPHPGLAGERLPDSVVVRVVDDEGNGVPGVLVDFAMTSGAGTIAPTPVATDDDGYARTIWLLGAGGAQEATARVDGVMPARLHGRVVTAPAAVRPMLGGLGDWIDFSIGRLNELLPLNPQSATHIEAKLAMLRTRGLGGDILDGRRYAEGSVASRSGAALPVTALFPLESMRGEAELSVASAAAGVTVLEEFLGVPFPAPFIRIWQGFTIGNTGGGGGLNMEDRATYEARTPPSRLPYDAILVHEVSHSWVGNESLTQFLELYGYNVMTAGSADVETWTFTRGWVPGRAANEGVHALLDVYRLIGPAAMASAYRALIPLHPPYGQPLSPAVQQAFVDAAPAAAKAEVATKVARVLF